MIDKDRTAKITVGGEEYDLILTTRATKEITARFGGLEQAGNKLLNAADIAKSLDDIVWLIMILANQSVLIHNLRNNGDRRDLLTEEAIELLTTPAELGTYKNAIMEAFFKGLKRNIESDDNDTEKNQPAE